MKNIYKSLLLLVLLLSGSKINAQLTCMTSPSLGVYDDVSDALIPATIPCNYANLIYIHEVNWLVGNTGSVPCIRLKINPTAGNSSTNNSIIFGQGTNTNVLQVCPTCANTVSSTTNYTYDVYGVDPSLGHGYNPQC